MTYRCDDQPFTPLRKKTVAVSAAFALLAVLCVTSALGANTIMGIKISCANVTGTLHDFRSGTATVTVTGTAGRQNVDRSTTVFVPVGRADTSWGIGLDDLTAGSGPVTLTLTATAANTKGDRAVLTASGTFHCGPPIETTTVPTTTPPKPPVPPKPPTPCAAGDCTPTPTTPPTTPCIPPNSQPNACELPHTGSETASLAGVAGLVIALGATLVIGASRKKAHDVP